MSRYDVRLPAKGDKDLSVGTQRQNAAARVWAKFFKIHYPNEFPDIRWKPTKKNRNVKGFDYGDFKDKGDGWFIWTDKSGIRQKQLTEVEVSTKPFATMKITSIARIKDRRDCCILLVTEFDDLSKHGIYREFDSKDIIKFQIFGEYRERAFGDKPGYRLEKEQLKRYFDEEVRL